jgi:hypothetical protein
MIHKDNLDRGEHFIGGDGLSLRQKKSIIDNYRKQVKKEMSGGK